MKFKKVKTDYGNGVMIDLTGDEVATAVDAWLVANNVHVSGARTVTVNGELCRHGKVFVDPSGFVTHKGDKV
jgi:putative transposon-encoded protein